MAEAKADGTVDTDVAAAAAATSVSQTPDRTNDAGSGAVQTSTETKVDAGKVETKAPESLLDRVKQTLEKGRDATAAAAGKADAGSTAKTDAASTQDKKEGDDEDRDPTDDELAQMQPNDRRSTRRALRQRNEARDALRAFQAEVEPDVEGFRRLVGFVNQNGLETAEVNTGLGIMAAMKNDPEAALRLLEPYYIALLSQTGRGTLPADLQKAVDDGEITEPHARRLAAAEAGKGIAARRTEQVETKTAEEKRHAEVQAFRSSVSDTLNNWEARQLTSDPDYKQYRDLVEKELVKALKSGDFAPRSQQEAVTGIEKIYADIKGLATRFRPSKAAVDITPLRHINGTGATAAKPQSFAEAIRLGVTSTH
jgi:hypothetical protein